MELNSTQLLHMLKWDTYTRKDFLGIFAFDEIPHKIPYPSHFIINTDVASRPGEHWLAIHYDQKGHATFFDSYGNKPSFFRLEAFLNRSATSWEYNSIQLQDSFSSLCGYYCVLFLLEKCRHVTLINFQNLFKDPIYNDNMIISLLKQKKQ